MCYNDDMDLYVDYRLDELEEKLKKDSRGNTLMQILLFYGLVVLVAVLFFKGVLKPGDFKAWAQS